MLYLVLFSIIFLPIIISILFSSLFNSNLRIAHWYVIEGTLVFILTSIGHFYYFTSHKLPILPAYDYMKFSLGISLLVLVFIFLFELITRFIRKKKISSFKRYVIIYILFTAIFIWLIPLGQKYYYAERVAMAEMIFSEEESNKLVKENGLLVGLVASAYDRFMRPRYRMPGAYSNYMYVRNTESNPFKGHVYLTLFNENNQPFEMKLLEDVEVEAQDTQLLVIPEDNKVIGGKWDQRSFKSKQKAETFEVMIVSEN